VDQGQGGHSGARGIKRSRVDDDVLTKMQEIFQITSQHARVNGLNAGQGHDAPVAGLGTAVVTAPDTGTQSRLSDGGVTPFIHNCTGEGCSSQSLEVAKRLLEVRESSCAASCLSSCVCSDLLESSKFLLGCRQFCPVYLCSFCFASLRLTVLPLLVGAQLWSLVVSLVLFVLLHAILLFSFVFLCFPSACFWCFA
jgi:hypothetical protein